MSKKQNNQSDLPGMEDRQIEELHSKALEYAAIRDERMELTKQESSLKGELLDLMHKCDKESYIFEGIEVTIEPSEETVKVKVHKSKTENEEAA